MACIEYMQARAAAVDNGLLTPFSFLLVAMNVMKMGTVSLRPGQGSFYPPLLPPMLCS